MSTGAELLLQPHSTEIENAPDIAPHEELVDQPAARGHVFDTVEHKGSSIFGNEPALMRPQCL
jgi:hypothetical protein